MDGQLDMAANVRISYLDVMDHTLVRQKKLKDQYYFLCQCNRCLRKQFNWKPNQLEKNPTVSIVSVERLSNFFWHVGFYIQIICSNWNLYI